MDKLDRRAQRTREQLQQALIELIATKSYDSITVQDITERANLGRTTFYAHFHSKTELYLSAHFETVAQMGQDSLTLDQLLSTDPPAYFVKFLDFIVQDRATQLNLTLSQDILIIGRAMRQHVADIIEHCLRSALTEQSSHVPFKVLANYIGGAQVELVSWWVESHYACSAQELAMYFQQMQRATLRDALHLSD
jgi:AcrR family transcriptional regulator